jgi:hypothetical protein
MRRTFAVLLPLALAACQTAGSGPEIPSPQAYAPPPPPPASAIIGHANFHLKNGGHGSCTGLSVVLMRDTPSFRDRVAKLYGSTDRASLPIATVKTRSARLGPSPNSPLVANVQCDGAGFRFDGVAPGAYYVIGRVKLAAPTAAPEDYVMLRSVEVADGQVSEVSLAP